MKDDYLEAFLGDEPSLNVPAEGEKRPDWAVEGETSGKAYDAIISFKEVKLSYINDHSEAEDFETKSSYQISKVDVARVADADPQPIFRSKSVSYSGKLLTFFTGVNEKLNEKKEKKLNKPKHGLQHLSKKETIKIAQSQNKELVKLQKDNCEELYERLLSNMPLDIKNALGLK